MGRPRIWLHCFPNEVTPFLETVEAALATGGVSTYRLDESEPQGPGAVLFGRVSPMLTDFVRQISHRGRERVLAIAESARALEESVWPLLHAGASDVFAWDHSPDPVSEIGARFARWQQVDETVNSGRVRGHLVGQSPVWNSTLRQVVEIARFTDASVLITGESGTGKELVARLIHSLDPRPDKGEMVILDCTTIVPELSGSEFFGHERGAFTGAVAARDGAFALADGGTLFLDEVGDLPPALQAEMLRVIQEGTYKRIGSNVWRETRFRLVCATNKDLLQEEREGRFRRDFYYRIASVTCRLPAFRERPEDVFPLVRHFWRQLRPDGAPPDMDGTVRAYLLGRSYPGNVRDLRRLVAQMVHRHVGPGPVTPGDIPPEERPPADHERAGWCDDGFEGAIRRAVALGVGLKEIGRAAEEAAERIALTDEANNLHRAALRLGVTDRALQLRRAGRRVRAAAGRMQS